MPPMAGLLLAPMQPEWSPRIGWDDLPLRVQAGIEQILGDRVTAATGQQGGFSPGTADRVRTVSGGRAFIKAVSPQLNEQSPAIHRKEAAVTGALADTVPAPRLIGTYDDGEWVALVLSDVEGRHPHIPWRLSELTIVLDALLRLARTPVPAALENLPTLEKELSEAFNAWSRIRSDPPEDCDSWVLRNLESLEGLALSGLKDLGGDSLVHTDIRADNILITPNNTAVLVDWPWACVGSSWIDALSALINVRVFDPMFDVESVLQSHAAFATVRPDSVDRVLAGLGAYFTDAARLAPPPGLPSLRTFQRQQSEAVVRWLRHRLSNRPAHDRDAQATAPKHPPGTMGT
ncbi:phosphotransferase [Arthrobacter sp. CJ23]|uniref:phosphotransferase n=1 Tax=Arthrobacter sp. CJ23 TaxID=2972479 RepID=UPI00215D13DB|nr:phosphotransferase [Arthrobacter sp. CJ23]UVJ39492.1 phosphotransferase [Arthrobacter sp. CJ23]